MMINIIGNAIGAGQSTANPAFIMEVDTTIAGATPNNQFQLRTQATDTYLAFDYDLTTSDGQSFTGLTGNITITFPTPGIYTLKITGKFGGVKFGQNSEGAKVTDILNWGDWEKLQWIRCNQGLQGCSNLTTLSAKDTPYFGNLDSLGLRNFFAYCTNFNSDISHWDVSTVTDFASLFYLCENFNQPLNSWDMSSAQQISNMFYECNAFNQDLNNWNTSSVTAMSGVFNNADAFNGDVSTWNTSNVTGSLFSLFSRTSFNGDLSNWDVSGVTSLHNTFAYSPFNNNSIVNWNVGNVGSMQGTFAGTPFNQDISLWNTANVTTMANMFSQNSAFNQPIGSWNVSNVTNMQFMFYRSYGFDQDLSSWDVSSVTTMAGMWMENFDNAKTNINIDGWTTTSLTSLSETFKNSRGITMDLSGWDVSNVTTFNAMSPFGKLNFDVSSWAVQGVVNLNQAFLSTSTDQQFVDQWDFSGWNISQATNLTNFIANRTLKTHNYDNTLISWSEQAPVNALTVSFGGSKYTAGSAAEAARNTLITTYGWTITDGGVNTESPFVMTVDTTLGDGLDQFTVPTTGTGYNYTINTSDGQTITGQTGNSTITFAGPGVYDIEISGDFPRVYFNGALDYLKLTKVKGWGNIKWRAFDNAFLRCQNMNLTSLNNPDLKLVTSLGRCFMRCTSFNGDISKWDVSTITNLTQFLYGEYLIMNFAGNISSWDVSGVREWYQAFRDNTSFNSDISGWDVRNARNFNEAFYNCDSLTADLSSWNPERADRMISMFFGSANINFDPSGWDFSRVRYINGMFNLCPNMNFNLSGLNLTKLLNGQSFISSTLSSATIDAGLNTWATQDLATNVLMGMGSGNCTLNGIAAKNKLINTYGWTITGAALDEEAFIITVNTANFGGSGSNQFTIPTFVGETYNYTVKTSDGQTITGITGNQTITFATPGIYTIAITGTFPRIHFATGAIIADKQKILTVERWGPQVWTSFDGAFEGCSNLHVYATDAPNLTACTALSSMFRSCGVLNESFASWNVSTITTMDNMFDNAVAYDKSLGGWNVAALSTASNMFFGAGMSRLEYENTLVGWGALPSLQTGVAINFGSATYAAGFDAETAKTSISTTYSWTFTDGGSVPFVPYIIEVDTSLGTGTNDFLLPLIGNNITVETSDGQVIPGLSADTTISFAAPGIYDIEVYGGVTASKINNGVDRLKLTKVKQWGDPAWTDITRMFYNASNMTMTAVDSPNLSKVNSLDLTFRGTSSFNQSIDSWDVSKVKSMSDTFFGSAYNQSLNSWDVSQVTNMYDVFRGAQNPAVSNWTTTRLYTLYAGFRDNPNFNQDLTGWDVSGVVNSDYGMFRSSPISGLNISNWDVRMFSVVSGMFEFSSGNPDITAWNMYGHNIGRMFAQSNFNQDISGWDISKTTSLRECFVNNEQFNQPIGSWDTSKVLDINGMFNNNVSQPFAFDQDISGWNVEKVLDGANFCDPVYVTLSTANYDALLIAWAAQSVENDVTISFGASQYTQGGAAEAARNTLTATYNWTITDGGGVPIPLSSEGLVASYSFDTDFSDLTGNHPLTATGTVTAGVAGGKVSNAVELAGGTDYMTAADSDDFSFTNGVNDLPFTISTWFYMDTIDFLSGQWLVCKRDLTGSEYQIAYYQGYLLVALYSQLNTSNNNLQLTHTVALSTATWYHITVTYDGSATAAGIKLYLNGSSVALTDISAGIYTGMTNTNALLWLGAGGWNPPNHTLDGKMDETHIWRNVELTAAEVLNLYNIENGGDNYFETNSIVASYDFQTNFNDFTGVNNGTASGTPVAGNPGGIVGNDLLNNGTSYVNCGNNAVLTATQYSISAWFKASSPGSSYRGVVVKQQAFGIFLQNNELGVYSWNGNIWTGTGQILNDGAWHHVVFTFDDGVTNGAQIYLDGAPLGSPFTYAINNQSVALVIGAGSVATTQSFNGEIDEVHIWTGTLLDANQVNTIYTLESQGNSIL